MPDLIERITGGLDLADQDHKIGLHSFCAALNEYRRGKITGNEFVEAFELTSAQTNTASVLVGLINAAPQKTEFMRVFKDLMYMGEANLHSRYRDISFIQTRLENEVTDQGGTLP